MADIELVIKIPKAYYELVIKKCKDPVLLNAFKNGTPLNEIRAKIAAKIGGNGSENDGLDKALAIIDEYIREGKAKLIE